MSKEIALEIIQKRQRKLAQALGWQRFSDAAETSALEMCSMRENSSYIDSDYIRGNGFKYPVASEQLRWQHTREIIKRTNPGGYENPYYLNIIAREAAAIEMVLRNELNEASNERMATLTEHILLASTGEPFVTANAESISVATHQDFVLIFISSGLIQFLYQAAKAVVLSWKPKTPPPGRTSVFGCTPEDIEAVLAKDPYPVELLLGTLKAYFFEGFPRDPTSRKPKEYYELPLSLLINLAERFVIAHEYAHALLHIPLLRQDDVIPYLSATRKWDKEHQADVLAFWIVLSSAAQYDLLPPNIALQGPLFALQAIDILREAKHILLDGEIMIDHGSDTHPPTNLRIQLLKRWYQDLYQLEGVNQTLEEVNQTLEGALVPSNTLHILWKHTIPKLEAWRGSAQLHDIWKSN